MDTMMQVEKLISRGDLRGLKALADRLDMVEAFHLVEDLPAESRVILFRLLSKDQALQVFEHLDPDLQQDLITSFREERAVEVFERWIPMTGLAFWMNCLPGWPRRAWPPFLPGREKTNTLLGYTPRTAGRIRPRNTSGCGRT